MINFSSNTFIFLSGRFYSNEAQSLAESETLIERLKRTLDDTVKERDDLLKNVTNISKKVCVELIIKKLRFKTSLIFIFSTLDRKT